VFIKQNDNKIISGLSQTQQYIIVLYLYDDTFRSLHHHQEIFTKHRIYECYLHCLYLILSSVKAIFTKLRIYECYFHCLYLILSSVKAIFTKSRIYECHLHCLYLTLSSVKDIFTKLRIYECLFALLVPYSKFCKEGLIMVM
jgi:hypothetical protein